MATSSAAAQPGKCSTHPAKSICAVCVQCCQLICLTCVQQHHQEHDLQDTEDAMDWCIQQAETTLEAIRNSITQKAQAKDISCFNILQSLSKIQSGVTEVPVCSSNHRADGVSSKNISRPLSKPQEAHLPEAALPAADSVNKAKLGLLGCSKLPRFKHIDLNRRNTLLLVSPDDKPAMYEFRGSHFHERVMQGKSADIPGLQHAPYVLLSQENEVVIPHENAVVCDGTEYPNYGRFYWKVHLFGTPWFVCTKESKTSAGEPCQVIEYMSSRVGRVWHECKLDAKVLIMASSLCAEIVIYIDGTVYVHGLEIVQAKSTAALNPVPNNIRCGASIHNKLLLLLPEVNILSVYELSQKSTNPNRPALRHLKNPTPGAIAAANNSITTQELGLDGGCEIDMIWAGDAPGGQNMLHVLYKQGPQQQHYLATYMFTQYFLDN